MDSFMDGFGGRATQAPLPKLSEHKSTDRHKRRWEEAFEILKALVSPIRGDDTAGARRRPSGRTAHPAIMEQADA
jgi:hypothetical protein